MKAFVPELWYWLTVVFGCTYVYQFCVRWLQTMKYSKGHRVVGLLAVSLSALCVLILGSPAMAYAKYFVWVGLAATSGWLLYNNLFVSSQSIIVSINDDKETPVLKGRLFLPVNQFLHKLFRPETALTKPAFFTSNVRVVALTGIVVFGFAFGFYRVVYFIHDGDQRVAAERKAAAIQAQKLAEQGKRGRDSLALALVAKNYQDSLERAKKDYKDSVRYVSAKRERVKQTELTTDLTKRVSHLSLQRPLIIVAPTAKQLPQTSYSLPSTENVKAPEVKTEPKKKGRRGKVQAFTDEDELPLARLHEYEPESYPERP